MLKRLFLSAIEFQSKPSCDKILNSYVGPKEQLLLVLILIGKINVGYKERPNKKFFWILMSYIHIHVVCITLNLISL